MILTMNNKAISFLALIKIVKIIPVYNSSFFFENSP